MKDVLSIIGLTFEKEFSKTHNILGWFCTGSIWVITNFEKINTLLTGILTLVSIVWVGVKIYYAIKNGRSGKSDK